MGQARLHIELVQMVVTMLILVVSCVKCLNSDTTILVFFQNLNQTFFLADVAPVKSKTSRFGLLHDK